MHALIWTSKDEVPLQPVFSLHAMLHDWLSKAWFLAALGPACSALRAYTALGGTVWPKFFVCYSSHLIVRREER